jgi:MFS family permease
LSKKIFPNMFYGYKIMAAGFVATMFLASLPIAFGVFFKPLAADLGWSRTELSFALTLSSTFMGISAFFLGRLTDRYGPRVVLLINGACLGVAHILLSQVHALWQLYLYQGLVMPIGNSGAEVPIVSTIARWFSKRRGMMIGVVKVGSGVGIMVVPVFCAWLIGVSGWRTAYVVIGVISLVVLLPVALVFKRDPSEIGVNPDNSSDNLLQAGDEKGPAYTIKMIIREPRFWMFALIWLSFIYCQNTVNYHLVNHITDLNIDPQVASTVITVYGAASIFGRLSLSGLSDKIGPRNAYLICHSLLILAFSWILFAGDLWQFYLFGAAYGFAHGSAYALLAPMATRLFGLSTLGSMVGTFIFLGALFGSVSALISGFIYDTTGNYFWAFLICLCFALTGFVTLFLIKKQMVVNEPTQFCPDPWHSPRKDGAV